MIIEDPKLKKRLDRIPDVDKNGDPIFKIAEAGKNRPPKRKDKKTK